MHVSPQEIKDMSFDFGFVSNIRRIKLRLMVSTLRIWNPADTQKIFLTDIMIYISNV